MLKSDKFSKQEPGKITCTSAVLLFWSMCHVWSMLRYLTGKIPNGNRFSAVHATWTGGHSGGIPKCVREWVFARRSWSPQTGLNIFWGQYPVYLCLHWLVIPPGNMWAQPCDIYQSHQRCVCVQIPDDSHGNEFPVESPDTSPGPKDGTRARKRDVPALHWPDVLCWMMRSSLKCLLTLKRWCRAGADLLILHYSSSEVWL